MKDKIHGFRLFRQAIVLKTKQEAARKELRFINQTRRSLFDKPSCASPEPELGLQDQQIDWVKVAER